MTHALPAQHSLWEATAIAGRPPTLLAGAHDTEVLVVGGGFAGLSCALHLAERGIAVTVLEAGAAGSGASGRNGGQLLAGGRHTRGELIALYGEAAGQRLHDFGAAAPDAAFALIRRLGLQCDAIQAGSIYAADNPAGLAEAQAKLRALQANGVNALWLDRERMAEATGSRAYLGGYFNPQGGSVQPLSLVRELARAAAAAGAQVHEQSEAVAIERLAGGWQVRTAHGRVKARRVLLATNGRPGELWPALERTVLPVWSFQVATDPLPASSGVLPGGATVSDTRRIVSYFRRDAAGRLVMGGKGTIRPPRGLRSFDLQRRALARIYPQLADAPIRYWWGGQVSVTLNRLPRFFVLDDSLFATVACNGKGVAWNVALGPVLADAMSGVPLDTLALPPARPLQTIPFHFFKQAYTAAGSAWLRLRDGMDNASPAAT